MLSRGEMLPHCGTGLGMLGLAGVLAENGLLRADSPNTQANPLAPRPPHFAARARRIIHLYMNGGPSQVDTFDPKPALARYQGQRPAYVASLRNESGSGVLMPS